MNVGKRRVLAIDSARYERQKGEPLTASSTEPDEASSAAPLILTSRLVAPWPDPLVEVGLIWVCTANDTWLLDGIDISCAGTGVGMNSIESTVVVSVISGIVPSDSAGSRRRAASRVAIVVSIDKPFSSASDMFLSATK